MIWEYPYFWKHPFNNHVSSIHSSNAARSSTKEAKILSSSPVASPAVLRLTKMFQHLRIDVKIDGSVDTG